MKVLTKNGTYYINKFLLEQIKQNNSNLIMEAKIDDNDILSRLLFSFYAQNTNYDKQYFKNHPEKVQKVKDFIDKLTDDEKEKIMDTNWSDNRYMVDSLRSKIAKEIGIGSTTDLYQYPFKFLKQSDTENNVVQIADYINQNIEKQAAEQNGDTQSADVQQPEQQPNEENKSDNQNNPKVNDDSNNQQPNEENKTDNQNENEEDNELKRKTDNARETWEKTKHIVEKINIFSNATQTIIQRAMYAIKMTLNIYGSDRQNDNFMKKFGSIVSGGYDYQYMANVDKSLALKYYLAALENVDSETYNYVKNGLFYDKNNKFTNSIHNQEVSDEESNLFQQTQIEMSKTSKELNKAVQSCVILFEVMNEQDINNMYNAILYDEILSSNYKMNSLRKLSAYGFRDQIIYFTKKVEGAPNLICLFVFRQKAREVRGIGNFAKKFGSNIVSNTPKVL